MTIYEVKRKLIDRLGSAMSEKDISSEDFVNLAEAVYILLDAEEYNYLEKISTDVSETKAKPFKTNSFDDEETEEKFDLNELWKGIAGLCNAKKKN